MPTDRNLSISSCGPDPLEKLPHFIDILSGKAPWPENVAQNRVQNKFVHISKIICFSIRLANTSLTSEHALSATAFAKTACSQMATTITIVSSLPWTAMKYWISDHAVWIQSTTSSFHCSHRSFLLTIAAAPTPASFNTHIVFAFRRRCVHHVQEIICDIQEKYSFTSKRFLSATISTKTSISDWFLYSSANRTMTSLHFR